MFQNRLNIIKFWGLCPIRDILDSILKTFSFLFDFTLFGAGLILVLNVLKFRSNLKTKNELLRLQARISILRMNIRAKVKRRANEFRKYFAASITPDDLLDKDLNGILEIKFEIGADFQKYFDSINNIHSMVTALNKDPNAPTEKYFEEDPRLELVILRFVKEMKDSSKSYIEKAEKYNKANPKQKIDMVDPLNFDAMSTIENALCYDPANAQSTNAEAANQVKKDPSNAA